MQAAQRAGLRWPNVCGGNGECRVCRLEILDRQVPDPPHSRAEQIAADNGQLAGLGGAPVRLACQLIPPADMTVRKAGVRRAANAPPSTAGAQRA